MKLWHHPAMMRVAFLLVLLACTTPVAAFGPLGHGVVAEIAARALTPVAARQVETLFGKDAGEALREESVWVHEVPEWPGLGRTGPMHYVNFPRGQCDYVAARDCREARCVVGGIERFASELQAGGSPAQRRDAIRWLVHLVADVHQPLHAAWGDDRGGNTVQLRFRGEGTNLHKLWDSDLIRTRGLRSVPYAEMLLSQPRAGVETAWSDAVAARWAEESCVHARDSLYPPPRRFDQAYVDRHLPMLESRMVVAGLRLAALLNAALQPRFEPASD